MGLSASQAKLLSITCRISDNELRSQSITAAKMALANQSAEASREYLKALNTKEFIYRTYDDSGEKIFTKLTGAQFSGYAPLKNQYALINPQGQILVSELDATNYENSNNMNEFLTNYGVELVEVKGKTQIVQNPDYEEALNNWKLEYERWQNQKPDESLDKYWETTTGTVPRENDEFKQAFDELKNVGVCYNNAIHNGDSKHCYLHVLDCLIDFAAIPGTKENANYGKTLTYKTTTGDTLEITDNGNNGIGEYTGSNIYDEATPELMGRMTNASYAIHYGWNDGILYAPENSGDRLNISSSKKTKLLSSYYIDENGEKQRKTMYQYLIDTYFAIKDNMNDNTLGTTYNTELTNIIENIQNNLTFKFDATTTETKHTELWYADYNNWLEQEPEAFNESATIEKPVFEYNDKDKAQWYINLWHRMNGESEEKDGTMTTSDTKTYTDVTSQGTTSTTRNITNTIKKYNILEDGLMNSKDWLKYALESGTVTLERVNFTEPTEEGTGLKKATWTAIIYTNALDISEQTDETAIAGAEAKYQQKTKEIENKDKQYDSMLKLLDTEHNALQQEYTTAQEVIKKNIARTIKIYQA